MADRIHPSERPTLDAASARARDRRNVRLHGDVTVPVQDKYERSAGRVVGYASPMINSAKKHVDELLKLPADERSR
jgi:hypothetical protein